MKFSLGSAVRTVALLALASLMLACGGGGGGGGSRGVGVLTYFVYFPTGFAGSADVRVLRGDGSEVGSDQFVNAAAASPQQLTFQGLPNTKLFVHAVLYSGPTASGTVLGTSDSTIDGSTASVVQNSVNQTITKIVVEPTTVNLNVGLTQQLVAEAFDANNRLVFLTPASAPQWSTLNSQVAAVGSSSGIVTAAGVGNTTITAAVGAMSGSTTVNVTTSSVVHGKWTVMLFLNAANSLDTESYLNVQQLENIATTGTDTRFVIEWKLTNGTGIDANSHPFNGTRRYLVGPHKLNLVQDLGQISNGAGVDMGDPNSVNSFIVWAQQNYPADHYALILWDHGNGWRTQLAKKRPPYRGISEDDETNNFINSWQLSQALGLNHVDILSFDACLMQMLEDADEIGGKADYMVSAEDNTPGPGYPYDVCFGPFVTNPTASVPTLAKGIVDGFMNNYINDQSYGPGPLSQSVVDLSKIPTAVSALGTFSTALLNTGSSIGPITQNVRANSLAYDSTASYWFYDTVAIANRFANSNAPSAVKTSAAAFASAIKSAVVYSRRNSHSPDSNGLSIEFGASGVFNNYGQYYQNGQNPYPNLHLAQQTQWGQFLSNTGDNP